jgi:hypothetical protein
MAKAMTRKAKAMAAGSRDEAARPAFTGTECKSNGNREERFFATLRISRLEKQAALRATVNQTKGQKQRHMQRHD